MNARPVGRGPKRRRAVPAGNVFSFERARIERALPQRHRYRYVQPRVEAEGAGWKVVSPNCSRSIDPEGGEIDIVWFEPQPGGLWRLHARDHATACWRPTAEGLSLDQAIERVLADPVGAYWP